jgi:hypothetical protein
LAASACRNETQKSRELSTRNRCQNPAQAKYRCRGCIWHGHVEKNDRQLKDYSSRVNDIDASAVFKGASTAAINLRRARGSVVIISSFAPVLSRDLRVHDCMRLREWHSYEMLSIGADLSLSDGRVHNVKESQIESSTINRQSNHDPRMGDQGVVRSGGCGWPACRFFPAWIWSWPCSLLFIKNARDFLQKHLFRYFVIAEEKVDYGEREYF